MKLGISIKIELIKDIAKDFGVCKTTVGNAIKKRTWRHVA